MPPTPSVITIGNFDGVHVGHAALVRRARAMADARSARVVALAFDPHPAAALRPGSAPPALTTFDERRALLIAAGADEVKRLTPTPDLLSLEPADFLDRTVRAHHAVGVVEGHDFHFGEGRAGTPDSLLAYASTHALAAEIVPPVMVDLCDQTLVRASSTIVRWLLEHGRVTDACRVLGRPWSLAATVVRNDQRGRTIGFPTANLDPLALAGVMLPADGVYTALATVPGHTEPLPAAVHIGPRPTFGAPRRVVEAHVIGWGGTGSGPGTGPGNGPASGAAEYGWPITLRFLAWLREPVRFDGLDAIKAQLRRDTERAAEIARRYIPTAPVPTAPQEALA